jgi:hypothetical protein
MPRQSAVRKEEQKHFSHRMLVLVKRDMTNHTPKVIWAHELPLLEEIHGEGNIEVTDASVLDDGYSEKISPALLVHNKKQDPVPRPSETHGLGYLFIGAREMEYQRLTEIYGRCADENMPVVEKVYGRFRAGDFARLTPVPELSDLPVGQLRGLLLEHGIEPQEGDDLVALAKDAGIETE